MAQDKDQNEFPLPAGDNNKRTSSYHLPKYFRTDKNQKFLQSTLDQLIQPGVAEKINGFVGRKTAKAFVKDDNYVDDVTAERRDYQLEPVSIIKDNLDNVEFYADYRDYMNQIANFGGVSTDHSKNNKQEFYTWQPHIDWDKFTNFREYYWLPNGPQTVVIPGEDKEVTSTYTVNLAEALGDYSYMFTPDGLTNNPVLKLYRGVKYVFEVNTPGLPLTFKTARTLEEEFLITEGVSAQSVEQGIIELVLGPDAPAEIFYVAENDINVGGVIKVANASEATTIDVDAELIGKKSYTSRDGWTLTNGLKVRFEGEVQPAKYQNSEWYVEGVGDRIQLVSDIDVEVSFPVGIDLVVPFDGEEGFDRLPFGTATGYPRDKDYITINRASPDGNFWSRYNRWYHKEVIDLSASINESSTQIDETQRANRPIIEFNSGLKLYNFGTKSKQVIDVIDDYTTDAFSTIEGSLGYNIDSQQLSEGMRVMFLADTDPLVNGKIFEVKFIKFKGSGTQGQISLVVTDDSEPQPNENVLITKGTEYAGALFYYDGTQWNRAQEKTSVNQAPLFDLFDVNGYSFSDLVQYPATTFRGTRIFGYKEGTGTADSVLGFPLTYRSINNVGDIVFNFDYNSDNFEYQINDETYGLQSSTGYIRKFNSNNQYTTVGRYEKADSLSKQEVLLQYINDGTRLTYPINCYDQSALITDLKTTVFVNDKIQIEDTDYTLVDTADKIKSVSFITTLTADANIIIKTCTNTPKNENGHYEIAHNLERNPLNENVSGFTLGEVTEHVSTITENIPGYTGIFPGPGNLRDIANQSQYGRKFIKNSSPLNLSMFSLLDRESNVINAMRYSRKEYSKFKRLFLETAETLGYEGPVKQHVDIIIKEINKDKTNTMPFYFSDMIAHGPSVTTRITVEDVDSTFFALNTAFTLEKLNTRAVSVYLNEVQLVHNKDYTFNSEGYLNITASKQFNDIIEINEYETTNGTYIPATPTKLGLYPLYEPTLYVDDTYSTSPTMIQGHDGSIIKAYDDFRDNLIIELERRIFNNVKIKYDPTVLDINSYVTGNFRDNGFTREQIYSPMITDFVQWLTLVDEDYTTHKYFNRLDSFSFNYKNMRGPNNTSLPGWWRGAYNYMYDTDRPHTHPWEMLGFSIKPTWWETQYGPVPYTSENKILWEDIEKGIIRETGKTFIINKKYQRPGLSKYLPVDIDGNLLSPSNANLPINYDSTGIDSAFVFGDGAPVESAWRRSSDYPFAIFTSWMTNNPSLFLASGFDRSRQVRNILGQLVYSETGDHLTLDSIVFPNTPDDSQQILTSGVVNYVSDYMASNITASFKQYGKRIQSIKNMLGFKLGGFTDKSKFKLILDSRTPLNKGNVFIPEENYNIVLNTSSAIKLVNYSGVIIEKQPSGFVVRGYSSESPAFRYHKVQPTTKDVYVNVGGVSEPYTEWQAQQTYIEGKNVQYQSVFYKVLKTHTSAANFEIINFAKIPQIPISGGSDAYFRDNFDKRNVELLPYGTELKTIQDVVDFLLGYQSFLKSEGFNFEFYDGDNAVISDWKNSCREFMFWSTQNWAAGAIISLSPVADEINFSTEYSVVDNIFDNFFGYSLLKADGTKLDDNFTRISRSNPNNLQVQPKNTSDGVYAIRLPIVQKEHIVLIDNLSVFGDVIYQPSTGYRQERIKVLGYKTSDWDGSLNIPGFIYNEAKVKEWSQWNDYDIGALIKYKEFYYTSNAQISGAETFDDSNWTRLSSKPESSMTTNFEYKTNQFADFYSLDTDNFDVDQQQLAQHLIGYQKRQYLENIINDDVSQYKFYQGMIQDKGTLNSLNKLFDVLSSADKESLDFYEEWAIKQGQYGASEGFDELELELDEINYRAEPQPIYLSNDDTASTDLVYRIKDFEVFKKPDNYTPSVLPTVNTVPNFTKSPGFVHLDDVSLALGTYDSLLEQSFVSIPNNSYVWISTQKQSWNVLQHKPTQWKALSVKGNATAISTGTEDANESTVTLTNFPNDIKAGDIIGLYDLIVTDKSTDDSTFPIAVQTTEPVEGFYKVLRVTLNQLVIETKEVIEDIISCNGTITKFTPVRVADFKEANKLSQKGVDKGTRIWIDEDENGNWRVLENTQPFNLLQKIPAEDTGVNNNFGQSLAVDGRNVTMALASPTADGNGKIFTYTRGGQNQNFQFTQLIEPADNISSGGISFGEGVAISADGKYIVAGAPDAGQVKSKFKGQYSKTSDYENTDIVKYGDSLWEAVVDIDGAKDEQPFGSFGSIVEVLQDNNITSGEILFNSLLAGNYPFTDVTDDTTGHILVRAPKDAYVATGAGDTVFMDWYLTTSANQDSPNTPRQPFDGTFATITEEFLERGLPIVKKVDAVLYIDSVSTVPGDTLQVDTVGASGYVNYTYSESGRATVYVTGSVGTWPVSGSLFLETGEFVGEFQRVAPVEETVDTSDVLGGYWWFDTDEQYTVDPTNSDEGRALAIYNVIPLGKADAGGAGGNVIDNKNEDQFAGETGQHSYIRTLSYQGTPGAYGVLDPIESDLFVMRAPKTLTDNIEIGDTIGVEVYRLPAYADNAVVDISTIGLNHIQTNKDHELVGLWDGYVDFELEEGDNFNRFEPKVGQFVRDRVTGATAKVEFYQRNSTSGTIFVSNVIGTWQLGSKYGEASDIEMLGNPNDPDLTYQVTRTLGDIKATSLGNDTYNIGKLCVFRLGGVVSPVPATVSRGDFDFHAASDIIDAEYLIYKDTQILGLPTNPNIPDQINFDWTEVYKIPADADGIANEYDNFGFFTVYERESISTFTSVGTFIFPETLTGLGIGSKIKMTKRNNLYKAFIGCRGNGTTANPGKIFFVNKGTDEEGIEYNWELAKDKRFKGEFAPERNYYVNDIVFLDGEFYTAKTNIQGNTTDPDDVDAQFNILDWNLSTNDNIRSVDFLGYVPNDTQYVPGNDSALQISSTDLIEFGQEFDVTDNGEVLAVVAKYANEPSRVIVYRNQNDNYQKAQEIIDPRYGDVEYKGNWVINTPYAVNDIVLWGESAEDVYNPSNTEVLREYICVTAHTSGTEVGPDINKWVEFDRTEFAKTVSISQDGKLIAIGAPNGDTDIAESGKIYVYKQTNGTFALSQTLVSTSPVRGEYFGGELDFDGSTLFASAFNASSDDVTNFDTFKNRLYPGDTTPGKQYLLDTDSEVITPTTFDNKFTTFKNEIANNGVVYVYEKVNDTLVFGQTLDYNVPDVQFFGRNITAQNNHIYMSLPRFNNADGKQGLVLDFNKDISTKVWKEHRTPALPVDVSKIKRVMLYDKEKNVIVTNLDYIAVSQGKIAGTADEEIRYKTFFDPSTYNIGTSTDVRINELTNWGENQVGQVWWDLTDAKFYDTTQGSLIYKTNNNNKVAPGGSIDIYEWVESVVPPEQWDKVSKLAEGERSGITGTSKYGNSAYVEKRIYDKISQKFNKLYYFWVKDKTNIPNIENRSMSVQTVASLIEDPNSSGYKFISFYDNGEMSLHNCKNLMNNKDIVLNIQYWTYSEPGSNIHNQYQILTEGLGTSVPYAEIENKWIDSLVGYDKQSRPVPDTKLSPRERYGILNKPRQGWFINKTEALKQLVERVNNVFRDNLIEEEKNLTRLQDTDPAPSQTLGEYDVTVDTDIDLQFIGVARATTASITPVVENGKIVRLLIDSPGRGYRVAPSYTIEGTGAGAEFKFTLDSLGKIETATVVQQGNNYNENTSITVRPFAALVTADSAINGKWALFNRNATTGTWIRVNSQAYDVTKFWNYTDWYATGYNSFTEIDHVITQSYELESLQSKFGEIIKILNIGGSGWLLLEKINDLDTTDYTVNYKTIGKQNGTIQLEQNLYNLENSRVGFDTQTFDTQFFDSQPVEEIRIIMQALKLDILTDDLQDEYNKLFFAGLRYVFAEQGYVDWAFKTSFVKATHNVGELTQRVTFKNDSLESYEDYIQEVKPYSTTIREYLSTYDNVERSSSVISDFDSPPRYDTTSQTIETNNVRLINNVLTGNNGDRFADYPERYWLENASYEIIDIEISDAGSGYVAAPKIEIEGTAKAEVSIGPGGKITSVKVLNAGSNYLTSPVITINGAKTDEGTDARLSAVLGKSKVRTMHTKIKFDRVSGTFFITQLNELETFDATGSRTEFTLKWPMDMRTNTVEVTVSGELVLNSDYDYVNTYDSDAKLTYGKINFVNPPANGLEVQVTYKKAVDLLDAQDRVNLFYNPTSGQIGNDISQLMIGVDYGGVEVKSFEFGSPPGWDTGDWYNGAWDIYDDLFEEELFQTDGSTLVFTLSKPLENGVKYNVYINGIRVDDEEYDGTSSVNNKNAFMETLLGDGIVDTLTIENENGYRNFLATQTDGQDNPPAQIIKIIKSTSDGARLIDSESYDTDISGGDLAYTTAKGIKAEEINIDGDGFVTETTSSGPEETIPGQVLDTLDITVFERPVGGSSLIQTTTHKGDGVTTTFNLRQRPYSFESVIIKINGVIPNTDIYKIDYTTSDVIFYVAPDLGDKIDMISMGVSGSNILDYDEFTTDGSTQEFLTNITYSENVHAYVTVNGEELPFQLLESDASYAVTNRCVIRFVQAPIADKLIQFAIFDNSVESFSKVSVEEIIADGSSVAYQLNKVPLQQEPVAYHTIVMVDNKVLNAGYSEQFTVAESQQEFKLKVWQVPIASVSGNEIEVYLNGRKLQFLQEWTYEGAGSFNPAINPDQQPGSTVILNRGVAVAGDELKVHIITSGEYQFGYYDSSNEWVDTAGGDSTPAVVYFDEAPTEDSKIRVYQFTNHDSQGIDRENYDIVQRTEMTVGSEGYNEYRLLTNGLLNIRSQAVSTDYVWVSLNGRWLTPTADYILLENKKTIKIITTIYKDDVLDIIHFSNPPVSIKYGWRQFKDILNKNIYKRLDKDGFYELAQDLNWYDRTITLVEKDNGNLPTPTTSRPGIVFVGQERIEYLRKEGNVLKQLRRGTAGTSIPQIHLGGTELVNQSLETSMPYKDEEQQVIAFAGNYVDLRKIYDSNTLTEAYESDPSITFDGIAYNFNNNTVFPLGGQVATVNGTGFRPTVQARMQNAEGTVIDLATTYVSETQFTFTTVGMPVGAYDLVIYNAVETVPILRPATSYVATKALRYVQVLLPFAPTPNPISATVWNETNQTGWYKAPYEDGGIPNEYWEAQDIEIFANGLRLRKNPLKIYDVTKGQFSPAGDVWLEAQYAVNKNVGAYVRLTEPPEPNTKLTIVRRIGKIWNEITDSTTGATKPLGSSETEVATFLRGKSIDLPR